MTLNVLGGIQLKGLREYEQNVNFGVDVRFNHTIDDEYELALRSWFVGLDNYADRIVISSSDNWTGNYSFGNVTARLGNLVYTLPSGRACIWLELFCAEVSIMDYSTSPLNETSTRQECRSIPCEGQNLSWKWGRCGLFQARRKVLADMKLGRQLAYIMGQETNCPPPPPHSVLRSNHTYELQRPKK